MDTIIIRLVDLPDTIHAVTSKDAEGDFNIYITQGYQQTCEQKHIGTKSSIYAKATFTTNGP